MVSFDSAAVYTDARLQSIAATRLGWLEDTGGPDQARGYEEILQRMLERHGPLGALALISCWPATPVYWSVSSPGTPDTTRPSCSTSWRWTRSATASPPAGTDPPALMSGE